MPDMQVCLSLCAVHLLYTDTPATCCQVGIPHKLRGRPEALVAHSRWEYGYSGPDTCAQVDSRGQHSTQSCTYMSPGLVSIPEVLPACFAVLSRATRCTAGSKTSRKSASVATLAAAAWCSLQQPFQVSNTLCFV